MMERLLITRGPIKGGSRVSIDSGGHVTEAETDKRPMPWRCPSCGTMLAKIALSPGSVVEIKCPRCRVMATKEAA